MNEIIKVPLRFYSTRFMPTQNKIILHFLGKREGKQRNERVTPEFGRY
jgi:hypothetical protein